jgi:hypothetical protein
MKKDQVRIREFHHVLLNVPHLIIAQGDETPVTGPGVIVNLPDQRNSASWFFGTEGPDVDPFFLSDPFSKTIHPLGKPVRDFDQESQQVLLFGETARFDQPRVVRRVVGHPHTGG